MHRAGVAVLLLLLFSGGCRGERRWRPTTGSTTPSRVVTLAPNLTEIVFALGAGNSLVGVSDYSDFPPEARGLPRVGGLEVDPEKVASLKPDLVIATHEGNARGPVVALEAAGVPVLTVPTGSLDAVLEAIRQVAIRLSREQEGERLIQTLSGRRAAARSLALELRPRAVLLVWPDPPQAAGGGTFLHDVLEEAGAHNLLQDRPGWPVISAEYLATQPMDVLVLPDSEETRGVYARALQTGPLSRGTVARARVIWLDEASLTRPGPRVFDALERLAQSLAEGDPMRPVAPP